MSTSVRARKRTFRSGEVIFHRDDPGQVLYVIKEGKVKICLISPEGQEISLVVFGKGECFGEFALLDGLPRSADAIALEKVECYTLQRSDFHRAIIKNPKIAIQVLEELSKRLTALERLCGEFSEGVSGDVLIAERIDEEFPSQRGIG